jgi:predicted GNAT family acetyltransferase
MTKIIEVDVAKKRVREELVEYLRPHETHALFLLGNMVNHCYPSATYVARQGGMTAGVCSYWPLFQSCSMFSENHTASRALAQMVLKNHPAVKTVLGMADMVKPTYDEFIASGRSPTRDPENLFFELATENFVPFISPDGIARRAAEGDVDAVVRLTRILHQTSIDAPLTDEERLRAKSSPITACLEIDGKVVAVASSNGLAIQAFQILGVATDPAYRRKGYAKAVCSFLISSMREQGGRKAILFTGEKNTAAIHCYLDLGFQITDRYYFAEFGDSGRGKN